MRFPRVHQGVRARDFGQQVLAATIVTVQQPLLFLIGLCIALTKEPEAVLYLSAPSHHNEVTIIHSCQCTRRQLDVIMLLPWARTSSAPSSWWGRLCTTRSHRLLLFFQEQHVHCTLSPPPQRRLLCLDSREPRVLRLYSLLH